MPDTMLHPTCMLSHFINEEIETQKLNDLPRLPCTGQRCRPRSAQWPFIWEKSRKKSWSRNKSLQFSCLVIFKLPPFPNQFPSIIFASTSWMHCLTSVPNSTSGVVACSSFCLDYCDNHLPPFYPCLLHTHW